MDPTVASVVDVDVEVDVDVDVTGNGGGDECELHFGTDDLDWAARWLAYLDLDLDVLEPPALTERLRVLGRWLLDRY